MVGLAKVSSGVEQAVREMREGRERRGEKRGQGGPCTFPQDLWNRTPAGFSSSDLGIVCQALASRIWFYEQIL